VIGRRNDLELVRIGEIRPRRAIRIDDAFRQKVQHLLILFCWLIGGEKVIEAPILADDDNDMFGVAVGIASTALSGSAPAWAWAAVPSQALTGQR
jgi:hypothetical protein